MGEWLRDKWETFKEKVKGAFYSKTMWSSLGTALLGIGSALDQFKDQVAVLLTPHNFAVFCIATGALFGVLRWVTKNSLDEK